MPLWKDRSFKLLLTEIIFKSFAWNFDEFDIFSEFYHFSKHAVRLIVG